MAETSSPLDQLIRLLPAALPLTLVAGTQAISHRAGGEGQSVLPRPQVGAAFVARLTSRPMASAR